MKRFTVVVLLVLIILVACGGGADPEYQQSNMENKIETTELEQKIINMESVETIWISSHAKRIYDKEFGIVCYQDYNDLECFEVGGR